ncbi:MAG: LptF/LptG family permease [Candidatus Omnitrophica bacterium]|nr:LptF/LptG family permease [Candidatus Omnitrophota bacterium]
MRILRNYLLKEFIGPLFLALSVLTFVMVLGNLIKMTDLIIRKGIDPYTVLKLFLFMLPYLFSYTLPMAVLAAILLALGRLSGDNEITAIKASGINFFNLLFPLYVVGIILSLILVVFNTRAIPYAHYASRKILKEIGIKNPTVALEPGVFINSFERYIIFIYEVDQKKNRLYNVRIYEPQPDDKPTRTIVAKKGEFIHIPEKNQIKLKLIDGTSDEPDPQNPKNFYKLNFKTYFMTLNLSKLQKEENLEKKPKDMTLRELINEIKKLRNEMIEPLPFIIEINKKIALAFSCFIFILFGSPFALITQRREKSINFGLTFLIAGIYYLMLIGSEALSLEGRLNPTIAIWLPNIFLGILGILLTYKVCRL